MAEVQKIEIGDKVQSFDFEHREDCFVEGTVVAELTTGEQWPVKGAGWGVVVFRAPCPVYVIQATGRTFGGEKIDAPEYVFPPVNGTPQLLNEGPTNFVRKID